MTKGRMDTGSSCHCDLLWYRSMLGRGENSRLRIEQVAAVLDLPPVCHAFDLPVSDTHPIEGWVTSQTGIVIDA
jgi:hypothetical protein